ALAALAIPAAAQDLYVDPDHGDDAADGASSVPGAPGHGPVKTIAHGLDMAVAGDTLHLAQRKEPYHESIIIHGKSGAAGKPITIDGHDAVLTGCDPLRAADWQRLGPGLYKSDSLYAAQKMQ